MYWLLFFGSIGLTVVSFLYGDKIRSVEEKKHDKSKIIDRIKKNSEEIIHFTFEECTFTRLDTIEKSGRWARSKSKSLGVDRKGQREKIKISKTKITCSHANSKREFVSTFLIDIAVAKTKTQQNNGVTVYSEKEDIYTGFGEEEYYMDLDFLEPDQTNT